MPAGTPAPLLAATDAEEVHLAFPSAVYDDLQSVLFPTDDDHPFAGMYERGAFCVVTRSTGTRRVSYLVRDVVHPESPDDLASGAHGERPRDASRSWLDRQLDDDEAATDSDAYEVGLKFSAEYHQRAIQRATTLDGGLLRVHTHPRGVTPSPIDRRSAKRVFSEDVNRLPAGAPLVAAITNSDDDWSARVYEFGTGPEPYVTPVTAVRVVGPEFEKLPTPESPQGPAGAHGEIDTDQQDSTIQLWGPDGQRKLGGLRVGLVGCGGVGSILAAHLPRLGVGELVLVDFDRLEPANANRAAGATEEDVQERRLKTTVAQREAHTGATAPGFETTVVDGSPIETDPEYAAVPELLDCDIIITAVDAARPRQVLDHIATAHCIPVLNTGSRLHADDGGRLRPEAKIETSITGPRFPCFECQRVWSLSDVEYEREHPRFRGERGYVDGGVDPDDEPRSPSVIGINDIAAGLVQHRLQTLVLGVSARVVGTHRLKPYNLDGEWFATAGACEDTCSRPPVAGGDQVELPTGTDWSMRYERDDIPMPETTTISSDRADELLDRNS